MSEVLLPSVRNTIRNNLPQVNIGIRFGLALWNLKIFFFFKVLNI